MFSYLHFEFPQLRHFLHCLIEYSTVAMADSPSRSNAVSPTSEASGKKSSEFAEN